MSGEQAHFPGRQTLRDRALLGTPAERAPGNDGARHRAGAWRAGHRRAGAGGARRDRRGNREIPRSDDPELLPDPASLTDMERAAERLAQAITQPRESGDLRRLRCRRRGVLGAAEAVPGALRRRGRNLHSRPHLRRLRPQPRGDARTGRPRREADRHGRLRHQQRSLDRCRAAGRRRRRGARPPSGRRAAADGRGRRQSQPRGRSFGAGPSLRGRRGLPGAGADREDPSHRAPRRSSSPIFCRCSISWRWRRSAMSCR